MLLYRAILWDVFLQDYDANSRSFLKSPTSPLNKFFFPSPLSPDSSSEHMEPLRPRSYTSPSPTRHLLAQMRDTVKLRLDSQDDGSVISDIGGSDDVADGASGGDSRISTQTESSFNDTDRDDENRTPTMLKHSSPRKDMWVFMVSVVAFWRNKGGLLYGRATCDVVT